MVTIDKITAGILFSFGFRLVDKEGSIYEIASLNSLNMELYSEELGMSGWETVNYDQIGTDYWILKRPYSDMNKPIVYNGEEVTPVDYLNNRGIGLKKYRYAVVMEKPYILGDYYEDFNVLSECAKDILHSMHFIDLPEGTYKEIE